MIIHILGVYFHYITALLMLKINMPDAIRNSVPNVIHWLILCHHNEAHIYLWTDDPYLCGAQACAARVQVW